MPRYSVIHHKRSQGSNNNTPLKNNNITPNKNNLNIISNIFNGQQQNQQQSVNNFSVNEMNSNKNR
jgi:hypothetical protein